jgi:hypothetical protein
VGFIARWEKSGAAERANYQLFLSELCDWKVAMAQRPPLPNPPSPDMRKDAPAPVTPARDAGGGRFWGDEMINREFSLL